MNTVKGGGSHNLHYFTKLLLMANYFMNFLTQQQLLFPNCPKSLIILCIPLTQNFFQNEFVFCLHSHSPHEAMKEMVMFYSSLHSAYGATQQTMAPSGTNSLKQGVVKKGTPVPFSSLFPLPQDVELQCQVSPLLSKASEFVNSKLILTGTPWF